MEDQSVLALKRMGEGAVAVGLAMKPLVDAFTNFATTLYATLWDAYLKVGAPYGETQKGLERWLQEMKDLREAG